MNGKRPFYADFSYLGGKLALTANSSSYPPR